MELFYRRNKKKIEATLVLFGAAVLSVIGHKLLQVYAITSGLSVISFWIAAVLLLSTISAGIYLMVIEYYQSPQN